MHCNAMQCNAIQYNTMQCNAMRYNAMQCNAMQCNVMQCNAMQGDAVQYGQCTIHIHFICHKFRSADTETWSQSFTDPEKWRVKMWKVVWSGEILYFLPPFPVLAVDGHQHWCIFYSREKHDEWRNPILSASKNNNKIYHIYLYLFMTGRTNLIVILLLGPNARFDRCIWHTTCFDNSYIVATSCSLRRWLSQYVLCRRHCRPTL